MMDSLDEIEKTQLRFKLAGQLIRMPYGNARIIDRDTALAAWPPTGDHDRSMAGAFRAMALANGGNRPEDSYTTIERIQNDLDESFSVCEEMNGGYSVARLLRHCPRCRGSGQYRKRLPSTFEPLAFDEVIPMTATETVEIVECDHRPID